MSEIKALTAALVTDIRDGLKTPQEAVAAFEKITPGQIRTGRIYEQKSREQRIEQYRASKGTRITIRQNRIPFID